MNPSHLDHITLRVPDDRVDEVVQLYGETLGFGIEDLDAYRDGERPIFAIRLSETSVVHVQPMTEFEPPEDRKFDHFAVVVEDSLDGVMATLDAAGVAVERELTPRGATGNRSRGVRPGPVRLPGGTEDDRHGRVTEF